ncbi:MAG TPA: DUF302 domain-containing protein [Thermoanaerobaculia bacterium]|jgi:uncharacterized protein (DUF302 family)|nr:DUF302 domain-containing protein [Thermoanaerobaculia bacterium]
MEPVGWEVEMEGPLEKGVERAAAALKEEGFGILTRIDVQKAFAEKLGKEFRPYVILGACNPALAYRALQRRAEAGLLLPCNVVVEEDPPGRCRVRVVNPAEMMKPGGLDRDPDLAAVGTEADAKLRRVVEKLRSSAA